MVPFSSTSLSLSLQSSVLIEPGYLALPRITADGRSHLPYLFIGKEHLQLANISLAKDWLLAAQNINATDPLVLNELGVVAYNQEE